MARIIMADDDELVGEIACRALMSAGHAVGVLRDGCSALKTIQARKPDLVILDCNMPEMNGLIVLRELRKSLEFFSLPVLILSARTSPSDIDLIFFEGADDYLPKPFDPDELVFRVGDLLEKHLRKNELGKSATDSSPMPIRSS